MLWFRLLGMAWKQKFLCFGLSSKWAKWVKVSRISTKDLSWKLLLTKTKKFIKREESTSQMCAYHISVAFWWFFLCLYCRWKKVHFCHHLISSDLGRTVSVDSAGLVCREGEQFVSRQNKLLWHQFVLLDQHCPTPSGVWKCCRVKSFPCQSTYTNLFTVFCFVLQKAVWEKTKAWPRDTQTCLSSGRSLWWVGSAVMFWRL